MCGTQVATVSNANPAPGATFTNDPTLAADQKAFDAGTPAATSALQVPDLADKAIQQAAANVLRQSRHSSRANSFLGSGIEDIGYGFGAFSVLGGGAVTVLGGGNKP